MWDPHATQFPVHLLNREPVFTGTSNSPPWQGGATAPQALSGRLANVVKYLMKSVRFAEIYTDAVRL